MLVTTTNDDMATPSTSTVVPKPSPVSIRLDEDTLNRVDALAARTNHSRAGLICLSIDAMLDYAERNGKLLLPKSKAHSKPSISDGN